MNALWDSATVASRSGLRPHLGSAATRRFGVGIAALQPEKRFSSVPCASCGRPGLATGKTPEGTVAHAVPGVGGTAPSEP